MASNLQLSPILFHSSSTSSHSSSSSLAYFHRRHIVSHVSYPPKTLTFHPRHSVSHVSYPPNTRPKKDLIRRWVASEVSVPDPPPPPPPKPEFIASLKLNLLSVVSGLNSGLDATKDDQQKANAAAKKIEAAGGPGNLSNDLREMRGWWKLIYSGAFSSQPPIGSTSSKTEVFQRIDSSSKDFDIIVKFKYPIELDDVQKPVEKFVHKEKFGHKFEVIGPSKVKIKFVTSKSRDLQVPLVILNALKPLEKTGSSEFEVTYLDADTLITRVDNGGGDDRGELWVWSLLSQELL